MDNRKKSSDKNKMNFCCPINCCVYPQPIMEPQHMDCMNQFDPMEYMGDMHYMNHDTEHFAHSYHHNHHHSHHMPMIEEPIGMMPQMMCPMMRVEYVQPFMPMMPQMMEMAHMYDPMMEIEHMYDPMMEMEHMYDPMMSMASPMMEMEPMNYSMNYHTEEVKYKEHDKLDMMSPMMDVQLNQNNMFFGDIPEDFGDVKIKIVDMQEIEE